MASHGSGISHSRLHKAHEGNKSFEQGTPSKVTHSEDENWLSYDSEIDAELILHHQETLLLEFINPALSEG